MYSALNWWKSTIFPILVSTVKWRASLNCWKFQHIRDETHRSSDKSLSHHLCREMIPLWNCGSLYIHLFFFSCVCNKNLLLSVKKWRGILESSCPFLCVFPYSSERVRGILQLLLTVCPEVLRSVRPSVLTSVHASLCACVCVRACACVHASGFLYKYLCL